MTLCLWLPQDRQATIVLEDHATYRGEENREDEAAMKTQRLIPLGTPQPIQVEPGPSPPEGSGAPRALRMNGRNLRVEGVREDWRIDDEWWRRPISRRYFSVILENGRLVTLYHDLVEGGWFLQP